jgi:hypothetical protein
MACSKECHHGLQLPGGGAIDRAVHRRCSTARIAMGQEAGRRSGGSGTPYSAAGYGADSAAAYGAGWAISYFPVSDDRRGLREPRSDLT